jgi:hypothetical protein
MKSLALPNSYIELCSMGMGRELVIYIFPMCVDHFIFILTDVCVHPSGTAHVAWYDWIRESIGMDNAKAEKEPTCSSQASHKKSVCSGKRCKVPKSERGHKMEFRVAYFSHINYGLVTVMTLLWYTLELSCCFMPPCMLVFCLIVTFSFA